MVRRIGADPAIIKGPLRPPSSPPVTPAPSAAPSRVTPVPLAPPSRPQGESAWMAEILFENQFDPRQGGVHPGPSDEAMETNRQTFSRAELQGAAAAAVAGEPLRSVEQYRALLAQLFDHKAQVAAEGMLEEPVLRSMREVWTPGRPEVNHHVALAFMRYFLPKLGEAYDFKPCPVDFNDTLSGGFGGLYDLKQDRVYLPLRVLNGTFVDFIAVLVHEQMHCMQERVIGRLNLSRNGQPLSPEERAIAVYWRNEQPKYRSAMANGSEMSPETRKRYRQIGQEYHSIQTGEYISHALAGS